MQTKVFDGDPCFGANESTVDYDIPCPSIDAFDYSAEMGIIRTPVSKGFHRQRRFVFENQPRTYQLTWALNTAQLNKWETFAQDHGYSWHFIPTVTGQLPGWFPTEHLVRFIEDYEVNLIQKDLWEVTVKAEQYDIEFDCLLELLCDEVMKCLDTHFPAFVKPDYTGLVDVIGDKTFWGNPNG